jgi:hypothetical protein
MIAKNDLEGIGKEAVLFILKALSHNLFGGPKEIYEYFNHDSRPVSDFNRRPSNTIHNTTA